MVQMFNAMQNMDAATEARLKAMGTDPTILKKTASLLNSNPTMRKAAQEMMKNMSPQDMLKMSQQQSLSYPNNKIRMSASSVQRSFGGTNSSRNNNFDCCSICLEEFQDNEIITVLPQCLHLFHTNCIGEWLLVRKSDTCPLCKTRIFVEG